MNEAQKRAFCKSMNIPYVEPPEKAPLAAVKPDVVICKRVGCDTIIPTFGGRRGRDYCSPGCGKLKKVPKIAVSEMRLTGER